MPMDKDMLNYFLIMALAHWAVYLVSAVVKGIVNGIHYLQDRINETEIGKRLDIDDRLSKYLTDAVEGMMPLAEDIKEAAADGKLTDAEKENLKNKAWEMFKGRALPKDWLDFGKILLPNFKPGTTERSVVEDAAKKLFEAKLPKLVQDIKKDNDAPVRGALPASDVEVDVSVGTKATAAGSGPGNS